MTLQLLSLCLRRVPVVLGALETRGKCTYRSTALLCRLSPCTCTVSLESPQGVSPGTFCCLLPATQLLAQLSFPYRRACWCLSLSPRSYFYHNTYSHWLHLYLLIISFPSEYSVGILPCLMIAPHHSEGISKIFFFSKRLDNN